MTRAPLFLALACALGACAAAPTPGASVLAPDFQLQDLSGKTVRLSDFRGHAVLVDFWAAWCDPCRESIPGYGKIYEARRAAGFAVLGVDEDDAKTDVAAFARAHAVAYPLLRDSDRRAYEAFRVRGLPTAILIGPDGRIARRWDSFDAGTLYEVERALDDLEPRK